MMILKHATISKGFIAAGLMNLSVLIFSKGFTNDVIPEIDPKVMSYFGLLMIAIWGLAYISVAKSFQKVKWLILVFSIEKLIYGIIWSRWMLNNSVGAVFEKDTLAGLFYAIYGLNDWLFCIFFALVFVKIMRNKL